MPSAVGWAGRKPVFESSVAAFGHRGCWSKRAAMHEALGRESLKDGYKLTAGEHLVRAAIYYHFAKFVFVQDQAQMKAAHMHAVRCYTDALPCMRPAGDGSYQVGLGSEVVADGGVVALAGGLADLPVRDRQHAVFGE